MENIDFDLTGLKQRRSKLSEADIIEMINLRKLGLVDREIADVMGVHTQTVVKWWKRARDRGYEVPDVPMGTPVHR